MSVANDNILDPLVRQRIERVIELTDMTFDHPEIDDFWADTDDYSALFFTVCLGKGVHGELPEPWMTDMNGLDLETCEEMLKEHGYDLANKEICVK